MGTKGFKIFFRKDEEDYLDDPITLLDFEERTVFFGSEEFLRNITIEDPGDDVSISVEDYKVQQKKSLLQLKELERLKERNSYLLKKCRSCSIKIVDCQKFPKYHQNKLEALKKTQSPITEHNYVEIEDEDKVKLIIDLTENDLVVYDSQYDNRIQEEYTKNTEEAKHNEFTSVQNAVTKIVRKQTYERLSKPILGNNENESHIKVPESKADQGTDLKIITNTRLPDKVKTRQKLKNNIESCKNSKNISHHLVTNLLLGGKSFTKNRNNLLKDSKKIKKEVKVSKDNNNNDCDTVHNNRKINKKFNKIKYMYTSEQISKTKIKLKKNSFKPKAIISIQNPYEKIKDKGRNPNLNTINRVQYDSLQNVNINHNVTNEKQQNNCENTQERVQYTSHSYTSLSSPVLTEIITGNENFTSLPNQNISLDRFHGCNKTLICADRIIPHFHENAFLTHSDILSKIKSKQKIFKSFKRDHSHL